MRRSGVLSGNRAVATLDSSKPPTFGDNISSLDPPMLRKRFHIGNSRTRSRISFRVPESASHTYVKPRPFRDPAAIPTLQKISRALVADGYDVTEPKVGKACDGSCRVVFNDVQISVVLLVHRRNATIMFEIMTWPSQSLRQRVTGRRMTRPDCREWAELASAIQTIVARDLQPETVTLRTFLEAEADADW